MAKGIQYAFLQRGSWYTKNKRVWKDLTFGIMKVSKMRKETHSEKQDIQYSDFIQSIFAVRFQELKDKLRQFELEVKKNIDKCSGYPHKAVENRLNTDYSLLTQLISKVDHKFKTSQSFPETTKDQPLKTIIKRKAEFLTSTQMCNFKQDYSGKMSVKQLALKYKISQTKVCHRIELLNEGTEVVPSPSDCVYQSYEELNEKLRLKLLKQHEQMMFNEEMDEIRQRRSTAGDSVCSQSNMEDDEVEDGDGLSSMDGVMNGIKEYRSERDPAEFTSNEAYFSE